MIDDTEASWFGTSATAGARPAAGARRGAGMDRHLEVRRALQGPGDARRERPAVPVVEEPAGVEDEGEVRVRQLGGLGELERRDEARPPARERFGIEEARARVVRGGARPLDPALAIEPRVRQAREEGPEARHLVEDRRRARVVELASDLAAH